MRAKKDYNTLIQLRANYATLRVKDFIEKNSDDKNALDKYKTRVRNLPSLLREDLLQGLVFLFSKKNLSDKSYSVALEQLLNWFRRIAEEGYLNIESSCCENPENFIDYLTKLDASQYLMITNEAIEISNWIKRFAEAMIDENS